MILETHIDALDLDTFDKGQLHKLWFDISTDATGRPVSIPLLIGRGSSDGPVLGLTAAVHGNELNGIVVIQKILERLDREEVHGTVIGCPVVNVPAFLARKRRFTDGVDLNHIMPGKEGGNLSESYAHRFCSSVLPAFNYLIDLHTASLGRVNSYYVRANMNNIVTKQLALLHNPQIVVHSPAHDGTLRAAAENLGIDAITVEIGNPNVLQDAMIEGACKGIMNAIISLGMVEGEITSHVNEPVICRKSYWMYTLTGGMLKVLPEISARVKKGEKIAYQLSMFGECVAEYFAPEDAVVIGKSVNPVNQIGGRILHLGIPA